MRISRERLKQLLGFAPARRGPAVILVLVGARANRADSAKCGHVRCVTIISTPSFYSIAVICRAEAATRDKALPALTKRQKSLAR